MNKLSKEDRFYLAGSLEFSGRIGASRREEHSHSSPRRDVPAAFLHKVGLGEIREYTNKSGKTVHGWFLTPTEELQLLKAIQPCFLTDLGRSVSEKTINKILDREENES